tara:strand:- start:90 stop:959 length:870 start_codon:yes stop_codon:yes gene_type:complete
MIQSMTGYGKIELNLENANFTIELKSLNSKQIDVNVKMSSQYRDKEISIRSLVSKKMRRGKIELYIWKQPSSSQVNYSLNTKLINKYFKQIEMISNTLNLKTTNIMPSLLKMPEVLTKEEKNSDENEWLEIRKGIGIVIDKAIKFRLDEGELLEKDILLRIARISLLLNEIAPFAKKRIEKVKKSLSNKLSEIDTKIIDKNRFEQELIYYLEKQDITEEQVRLEAHLDYFLLTTNTDTPNGKKLGFIVQEIGREINTIGSKSSDSEMQKIVVQMKDELEKIKEQLLNIL